MKVKKLIKLLKKEMKKHGNLPVKYYYETGITTPSMVCSYDEVGNYAAERVEIFIH